MQGLLGGVWDRGLLPAEDLNVDVDRQRGSVLDEIEDIISLVLNIKRQKDKIDFMDIDQIIWPFISLDYSNTFQFQPLDQLRYVSDFFTFSYIFTFKLQ